MISTLLKLSRTSANYIAGFIVNIVVCILLLARGFDLSADQPLISLLAVCLGLIGYGFLEYAIHRWIFHGNWLSDENPLKKGHAGHHEAQAELIAQPFFFPVLIGLAIWAPLSVIFSEAFISYFMFGVFTGYLYYGLLHHVMHTNYRFRSRFLRHLKALHVLHHKYPVSNFGIIGKTWDRVFGTYFRAVNNS